VICSLTFSFSPPLKSFCLWFLLKMLSPHIPGTYFPTMPCSVRSSAGGSKAVVGTGEAAARSLAVEDLFGEGVSLGRSRKQSWLLLCRTSSTKGCSWMENPLKLYLFGGVYV